KKVSARGKTILVSSHILAEMNEFCTAIGIMERGRMVVSGTVEEVSRQVMGQAIMAVENPRDQEKMISILRHDNLAGIPEEVAPHKFEFTYDGEPHHVSELLTRIVAGGVPVVSFGRKKEGLEELFLKVGAREVS